MLKRKKLSLLSGTALAFLLFSVLLNYHSFNYAKNACTENNKVPIVDKTFLAVNWSVSCE